MSYTPTKVENKSRCQLCFLNLHDLRRLEAEASQHQFQLFLVSCHKVLINCRHMDLQDFIPPCSALVLKTSCYLITVCVCRPGAVKRGSSTQMKYWVIGVNGRCRKQNKSPSQISLKRTNDRAAVNALKEHFINILSETCWFISDLFSTE